MAGEFASQGGGADELVTRTAPRQNRSLLTVDAILDAAEALIVNDGQVSFTANELSSKAGMSIGRVYYWFPDLDHVADALVTRISATVAQLAPGPETDRLIAAVSAHPSLPVLVLTGVADRRAAARCALAAAGGIPADDWRVAAIAAVLLDVDRGVVAGERGANAVQRILDMD